MSHGWSVGEGGAMLAPSGDGEATMDRTDARWEALVRRDPRADGRFVYGVSTTGVYCRPSCASRRPLRKNVSFFAQASAAEAAGFRACKRCRPDEASAGEPQRAAVERACALIRESDRTPTLAELARAAGMSRFHFHRVFHQIVGATPREFARAERLGRFERTLGAGTPVLEAAFDAGYGSASRAYAAAATGLGMTPGRRRRGGRGERVRFSTVRTEVGFMLVAATERGICAAELGDDRAALVAQLRARLPEAVLVEDAGALRAWADRIARFIATPDHGLDLPLDVRGTAFQARVWRALRRIPPGETRNYAEIARALGRPNAVRAVAQACASNRLAVLVPCHRVVRSDGGPGGYRWGVERKRALLAREAAGKDGASAAPRARARRRRVAP